MKYKNMIEIVEQIKDSVSTKVQTKVFDYHVAEALGMSYASLRVHKAKNSIPFEEIVTFCFKEQLNVYEFLVSKR